VRTITGKILFANKAFARLMGRGSATMLRFSLESRLRHPTDAAVFQEEMTAYWDRPKASFLWLDACLPPREPSERYGRLQRPSPAQYVVQYTRVRLADEEAALVMIRKQADHEIAAVSKAAQALRAAGAVAQFKRAV
jgi:PAS domain-containing protein